MHLDCRGRGAGTCRGAFDRHTCLGLELTTWTSLAPHALAVPGPDELAALNERAYGDTSGMFTRLVRTLVSDPRVELGGIRTDDDASFAAVALTFTVDDDVGIHYVATEEAHRRRGLASTLVSTMLAAAIQRRARTATLQPSADGLPVWERLGFGQVAVLRGFVLA